MDTNTINHVSLCSGYGGIDLGLKRAIGERLRTVAFVEVECFAVCNLAAKAEAKLLDNAPIWSDLRTFPWGKFHGLVDILSGGYPCQPFSAAGKRLGAEDPRHLWPHISAGIAAMRPSVCFFENVEGHISLGLPDVLQDLAGMGYRTTWCVASASECGAPHQRKRIFILAECSSQRGASGLSRSLAGHEGFAGIADDCGGEGCGELEHAQGARGSEQRRGVQQASGCNLSKAQADWRSAETGAYAGSANVWPSRPGEQQFAWEPPRVVGNAGNNASSDERTGRADIASANGERNSDQHSQPEVERRERGYAASGQWCGAGQPSDGGTLGHTNGTRPQERPRQQRAGIQGADADGGETAERQTQPPLGRDADGLTHRLDHAVLHVSTDNRTDELRLLGNGVVPATAERAFRVLLGELAESESR